MFYKSKEIVRRLALVEPKPCHVAGPWVVLASVVSECAPNSPLPSKLSLLTIASVLLPFPRTPPSESARGRVLSW